MLTGKAFWQISLLPVRTYNGGDKLEGFKLWGTEQ